jgi:hypothetical protein
VEPGLKISWMQNLYVKLREGRDKREVSNEQCKRPIYKSGMMRPGGDATGATNNNKYSGNNKNNDQ